MSSITIVCRSCGAKFEFERPLPTCPICNNQWLDAEYELTHSKQNGHLAQKGHDWLRRLDKRGATLWRYRELLPIQNDENIITLGEGWTPLLRAHNLGLMLGHPNIYIKDERQGPTGSFKDRQAAIAVSVMKEAGIKPLFLLPAK